VPFPDQPRRPYEPSEIESYPDDRRGVYGLFDADGSRGQNPHLGGLMLLRGGSEQDGVTVAQRSVHDPHVANDPAIRVVIRIEDQSPHRPISVLGRSGHTVHDSFKELFDPPARFGRDSYHFTWIDSENGS